MTKINDRQQDESGEEQLAPDNSGTRDEAAQAPPEPQDEIEILRDELAALGGQLSDAKAEVQEMKERWLRARADLENYRRRSAQELERARESGLDSAVLTVLTVYDDLGRALAAAEGEPSQIVGGVEAVRNGLRRSLEALGIHEVGAVGEAFDPNLHEALTSVPSQGEEAPGTIAEVYQVGFVKDGRLVRPARVVVYQ